jgi:predicted ATPase/class 3 adenylate cyclase/DNA-binding CsgD family transcriptional regulator
MSEQLPTGTVTLLLADVESSTRLWETEPDAMATALGGLDHILSETVAAHHGVRPVEQGEGDSFVVAFWRPSDALACALDLQRASPAPIRLRIGLHSGEAQLRDEGNYIGPTPNRAARLRDLAHGGQTVLSGATHDLVVDRLPAGAWLTDLGSYRLRDLARPERVVQLCHPDLPVEFPPLRSLDAFAHNLPVQLTSFVGRGAEMAEVRRILADNRLVTLTGAGGAGKTRLALQVAAEMAAVFPDGVWQVDLAPVTDPSDVPVAVVRALGLSDEVGRSTMDTLVRFVADHQVLVVLDNCEHLLDACAALVVDLLGRCPALTLLATSRESLGVAGEVTWRVPSLSLAGDAIDLFVDRARRCRSDFRVDDDNAAAVAEICRRLDGLPLAIELAAARVRSLSPAEIEASLHDRFRLLTGGARTAVRRQQTLRASVDWSHALLTEPERVLFRRLAAFRGGFDLDAAQVVCTGDGLERHQVLDQLASLVDKSLVVADEFDRRTRYRLLETVRQYALEKLGESGEADAVRTGHRDHFTWMAALLDSPAGGDHMRRLDWAEIEFDNLRVAFEWSRENVDCELALQLAASLQPVWLGRGRILEGLIWLDLALAAANVRGADVDATVRATGIAAKAVLDAYTGVTDALAQAEAAVAIARQLDDHALLARTLTACGCIAIWNEDLGRHYFEEAIDLARESGQMWTLTQILGFQTFGAILSDDPTAAHRAGEEGLTLAVEIGDDFVARQCRTWLAVARMQQGDLADALERLRAVEAEADAARDAIWKVLSLQAQSRVLAYQGRAGEARAVAEAALEIATELGGVVESTVYAALALAACAAGDGAAAREAGQKGLRGARPGLGFALELIPMAEAELASGDLATARRRVDEALTHTLETGSQAIAAHVTSARIASAHDDQERAERDAHDALACSGGHTYLGVPDALEHVAELAADADSHQEAARLYGAASALRHRHGEIRFTLHQARYEASVSALRAAMSDDDFESAWAEGAALSANEAIAYAQRGRGERKRPTIGWASLTPAELEVVRLVGEGLANKDIATRLFVSPRTVQSHLTHVYTKLGVTSRVQLAQEAARHA